MGASVSQTGLGAPEGAEPCGLGATPAIPSAGQWGIFKSYRVPEVRRIAKVTPKLVKLEGSRWPRQKNHSDLIACLDDEQEAMLLAQSLAGAAGQREKRILKARADFDERKASAWHEYERAEQRLVAAAQSKTRAEEQGA